MDTGRTAPSRDWLELVGRIDRACDRFEQLWRQGAAPRLEELLAEAPSDEREMLLGEALSLELDYRIAQGEQPTLEEYRRRLPEFSAQVAAVFRSQVSQVAAIDPTTLQTRAGSAAPVSDVLLASAAGKVVPTPLPDTDPLASHQLPLGVAHSAADTASVPLGPATAARYSSLLAMSQPFDELPEPVRQSALRRMELRPFEAGDLLLQQGKEAEHLLVVVDGVVDVRLHLSEQASQARPRRLARLGPGTVLGEISLLTFEPCTADVVATGRVLTLVLPALAFRDLVARHPPVGPCFHRLMASRLGGATDAFSGKQVEGYRILRCVGQGGMGVVYEGEQLAVGHRVALKMMSHRLAYNTKATDRFRREVEIGQSLGHPNVLKVQSWFMAFNTQFMAMEFCDGPTLHQIIRRQGPLDNDDAVSIVGQLASGLAHVHAAGLVHRDLKPANVMVNCDGVVKLTDFGLAKLCDRDEELTGEGEVLGTLRYMAPEQLLASEIDCRADLYSLGCVVYELITAKPLFRATDPLQLVDERFRWKLPPADDIRPGLDPRLYHVLATTLHEMPEDRTLDLAEAATWARPIEIEFESG